MAGAPKGNRNNRKGKDWENALRRVLAQYTNGSDIRPGEALSRIAQVCVEQALQGDKDARTEIANRLDGKPKETIDATFTRALAEELTDDELLDIARGSSAGATEATPGPQGPSELH